METMERMFARFGARLVMEQWLDLGSSGFLAPDSSELDTCARECGLMVPESPAGKSEVYDPLPGVEDAARLLATPPPTAAEQLAALQRQVAAMARTVGLDVRLPEGVE